MKNFFIFMGMIILVFSLWIGSIYFIEWHIQEAKNAGVFGDQFGAVNALFSGLAFAGLIYTILLQKEELKAQREELTLTRQEIEGQKLELKAQNETLALQRFENSFFSMLSQHNEMISSLQYRDKFANIYKGKIILKHFIKDEPARRFLFLCESAGRDRMQTEYELRDYLNNYFEDFHLEAPLFFAQYYRSVYQIFVFIEGSDIEYKKRYFDIIHSQFSNDEISMMFINGLSNKGEKFKGYINKYSLLRDFEYSQTISTSFKKLYPDSAYERF